MMGIQTGRNGGSHVAAQEQQGGGRLLQAQHRAAGAYGAGGSSRGGAACRGRGQVGAGAGGAVPCCLGAWGQEADLRSTGRMQGVAARREQRQRPGGEKGGARAGGGCRCKRKGAQEIGGLGCLYRGGEGILGLRVKKNGGTRPTRIGLRRRKKKETGRTAGLGRKDFFLFFLQKDSTNSI